MVLLPAEQRLRFLSKRVVRHVENDVTLNVAIRDEQQRLLWGWALSQRADAWDREVFPEFALRSKPFCSIRDGQDGLQIDLSPTGTCVGYHQSETCCSIADGKDFLLWVLGAVRVRDRTPSDIVDLIVARADVMARS
jgi:hypothetical protein